MNIDGLHVPNLIIAEKMCFNCINIWKIGDKSISCEMDCGIHSSVIGFSGKRILLDSHTI